ncbi:gamma-glutamyl-gamma-aminobutyraldehyde dehydrogenase [Oceanisphaera profunda]|uniref:Gamma-glutamyl-gamma-aminobutyraldehyde dehydrogenase n=1 Tax=Oceanisphaera profunda TaxID=1416627 RepID=A0A1Y0D4V3_9GAMM|nr:aldehyde dehydrogenase [Oceanisphaera profunda]ART82550.1 gamma-glutamyl-gamma-aminobutyraldehyde dehydrogenase [Oceanisphaera profunda]
MSVQIENVFAKAKQGELRADAIIVGYTPGNQTLEARDPFDESVIGQVEACTEEQVNLAVAAARASFEQGEWRKLAPVERKQRMQAWVALLEQHQEELAALDCVDGGKPISECLKTDIPETINTLAWYAEAVDKVFGKVAPTSDDILGLVVNEPIGVVAAVLPWNFPAMMFAWKVGPALVTGNSVIVKPAEQTSLSAWRMVKLAHQAGIPEGALQLVTGLGEQTGMPLGLHPDVDMVSFTGSTEVGRLFLQYSAQSNLKEIVLECGGKSPQLVFDDVEDLDSIVDDVLAAAFWNMGENCSCGSRLLVQKGIKEALLDKLCSRLESWTVGDPKEAATMIGPMVEPVHFNKVKAMVEQAKEQGARLRYGGNTPALGAGHFVEPTIFDEVSPDMTLFQDEVFGPVLAVTEFSSEEEAIALANNTQYGLAASLYTSHIGRAHRVSRALKAGTVSINCFSEGDITTPFGGYGQSGFGGKDNGLEAMEQYLQKKTIWYNQA